MPARILGKEVPKNLPAKWHMAKVTAIAYKEESVLQTVVIGIATVNGIVVRSATSTGPTTAAVPKSFLQTVAILCHVVNKGFISL
jgi:hypothetical protein